MEIALNMSNQNIFLYSSTFSPKQNTNNYYSSFQTGLRSSQIKLWEHFWNINEVKVMLFYDKLEESGLCLISRSISVKHSFPNSQPNKRLWTGGFWIVGSGAVFLIIAHYVFTCV